MPRTRTTTPRARRGGLLPRLVLVLGVLSGLFAMHGLAAGHDHTTASAPTAVSSSVGGMDHGPPGHEPAAPASHSAADPAELRLAVLAAVALSALPVRESPGPYGPPVTGARPPSPSRAREPRRPPDLSVLCVLRT